MSKPTLTILVGLPGSGKSYKAKELQKQKDFVIISSDEIRKKLSGTENDQIQNEKVFQIFYKRIRENISQGRDVIADATHISMKSRRGTLQAVAGLDCTKIAVILATPFYTCIAQNQAKERTIPESVLYRMRSQFEIPFYEEGFDNIFFSYTDINSLKPSEEAYAEMRFFDQKNPRHKHSLEVHCGLAYDEFRQREFPLNTEFYEGTLLHDYGKLFSQTFEEDGVAHYYQHHNIGAYEAMTRVIFMEGCQLPSLFLICYHMLPFTWEKEKTHEKYKKIFGEEKYQILMAFHECDKIASGTYEKEGLEKNGRND